MGKIVDLTGKRFGRILVLGFAERRGKRTVWNCLCDCGTVRLVDGEHLKSGDTKSCGCLNRGKGNLKHGYDRRGKSTRLYKIWKAMKSRCKNENISCYMRYGGRGIEICSEWDASFINFHDWAIANGYAENLTIDRINNDGMYCPENCRWSTPAEQARNRSSNRLIEYNGEKRCMSDWAEIYGLTYSQLKDRIYQGWSVERALTEPIKHKMKEVNS